MVMAALNAIAEPFEEREELEESSADSSTAPFVLSPIHFLWLNALLQFVSVVNPWNALNELTSMFEDESFIGPISFFVHAFGLAATTAGCVGELEENTRYSGIILTKVGLLVLFARPIIFVERARRQLLVRSGAYNIMVNIILMLWGMGHATSICRIS